MNDDTLQIIMDCENRFHKMNEWEKEFIYSVSERIKTKSLTQDQKIILDKIWEKIT